MLCPLLVEFIRRHTPKKSPLELYDMWEEDFSAVALSDQRIALGRLLDPDFYFRNQGHYTATID